MQIIEIIIEILFTSPLLWAGTIIGILIAALAWYFLPESTDRVSIGAWAVIIGFMGGLILSFPYNKNQ